LRAQNLILQGFKIQSGGPKIGPRGTEGYTLQENGGINNCKE